MQYLNPQLDIDAIRAALLRDRRVLIRDFFEPTVADALARAVDAVDWSLSFRDERGDQLLTGDELRRMDGPQRMRLTEGIHAIAADRFQFSFFSHSLVAAAQRGDTDLLTRFVKWMSTDDFLSVMRRMTDIEEIDRVYAQATMYSRGNFLLIHDDHVEIEDRRVAYVVNLTRQWKPHWGGLLHFLDANGDVADTFVPHFNSMSLFLVPQTHFVSYVAPYAQAERCAVTGWLIAGKEAAGAADVLSKESRT
jgi:SM-20-related protein